MLDLLKKNWLTCLIVILATLFVFNTKCSVKKAPVATVKHDTITVPGDSVPYQVKVEKPYPVYTDTGSWHNVPGKVDTMALLHDYLTKKGYYRTLKDDTSAFIAVRDSVFKNSLLAGTLEFQNRRKTQIIYNTTILPAADKKSKIYIGTGFGGNLQTVAVSGKITLITRNDAMYGFGVEYIPFISSKPIFMLSRDFLITFKK
jgi:hypothetical protein